MEGKHSEQNKQLHKLLNNGRYQFNQRETQYWFHLLQIQLTSPL